MARGLLGLPRGMRRGRWIAVVCAALFLGAAGRAAGADVETRDFALLVDGDKAGDVHMTISRQDDGAIAFSCDTDVRVGGLITFYKYSYRGKELWKDGRLQHFESKCNDNGKPYTVTATATSDGLSVRVNGADHSAPADAWLTSYWSQPDAKSDGHVVPLLDADTGRDLAARVQFLGQEKIGQAGQEQTVQHIRLRGKEVGIDLWYDDGGRLVRQEWVEDGHRTIVSLTGVRR